MLIIVFVFISASIIYNPLISNSSVTYNPYLHLCLYLYEHPQVSEVFGAPPQRRGDKRELSFCTRRPRVLVI